MKVVILIVLLVTNAALTHAWNARGHMIIAALAYQDLSSEKQQAITEILIQHPEFERKWKSDYQEINDDIELGLYLFMRASVWPDEIRRNILPSASE